MGDIMRPVPFRELLNRIVEEYRGSRSIFGIHESLFFRKKNANRLHLFGGSCDTPVGPAAGPHTQLAQNIITAYLCGGRFFELKTVQQMDELEIEKPCIDAEDEAFNTEWSSEYTVPKAYAEYAKAWVLIAFLEEFLGLGNTGERSFIFNMSVGYDLAGIKTPKMDTFIQDMMDSSENEVFLDYIQTLEEVLGEERLLQGAGLAMPLSPQICSSVTLSTMHGCPPDEIESISRYLLTEKQLHTYVKLNPTLLGYDTVRSILDGIGFGHVELRRETFEHDLQYPAAVSMLRGLRKTAEEQQLAFGVKLTNTLASVNNKAVLPGDEMYMSGRALYPVSISLAAKLAEEFDGGLPISYCGGVSGMNAEQILQTGIRPVTMATELLKPGGYLRMTEAAQAAEGVSQWNRDGIDTGALRRLADSAAGAGFTQKKWRGFDSPEVHEPLPVFDCYTAPCVHACPISQDVPQYIRLVGEGRYEEALSLIYEKNPLPAITGHICDHQCMYNCTRLDYDGAVGIRDVKKQAALQGIGGELPSARVRGSRKEKKAAVIGAGPAGLAAAFFLAREGFPVTVFEKQESAGGVVRHILPKFRIPEDAVLQDIRNIENLGVDFRFGIDPDISVRELKNAGYEYICAAVGAEKGNVLDLAGSGGDVLEALEFLSQYHRDPGSLKPGRSVAVVGGGNTAMDSARAAVKTEGVESVTVLYRRTEREMPADREEYEQALEEGVKFLFLRNPEGFDEDGRLVCRIMELGEPDSGGRRRPVPTDRTETMQADTVITAVGEKVDGDVLKLLGIAGKPADEETLETEENVFLLGDARTGPSTVVECIAEARKVFEAVAAKEGISPAAGSADSYQPSSPEEINGKKLRVHADGEGEAERCLECQALCNKCVEVCPNRANFAVAVPSDLGFRDPYQILHLDAYCNECGNCGTFCPYEGKPYLDKLTLFSLEEDLRQSSNMGFFIQGNSVLLRENGEIRELTLAEAGKETGTARFIAYIAEQHPALLGPVDR